MNADAAVSAPTYIGHSEGPEHWTRRGPVPARQWELDRLRLLAMLAVVCIHVAAPPNEAYASVSHGTWLISTAFEVASRWAVPCFIMLSGALLLTRRTAQTPVGAFYRSRASRVLLPMLAWTAASTVYRYQTGPPFQGWRDALASAYDGATYYHLYFLTIIVGLYCVAPFIARVTAVGSRRTNSQLAAGGLAVGTVVDLLPRYFHASGAAGPTYWVPYVGYFIAGAVVYEMPQLPHWRRAAWLAFALSFGLSLAATFVLVRAQGEQSGRVLYDYLAPPVIVMSIAVFYLACPSPRPRSARLHPLLRRAADTSFGVYLIHPVFLTEWQVHGHQPPTRALPVVGWILETLAFVLVGATLTSLVFARLPGLRRLV